MNQELSFDDPPSIDSVQAHGLIGQTVSGKEYKGQFTHIEGTPTDSMLDDEPGALWSTQCKFNLFR